MIDVVSADKMSAYLDLFERRPVEKQQRGFIPISLELIHYADAVDYSIKANSGKRPMVLWK